MPTYYSKWPEESILAISAREEVYPDYKIDLPVREIAPELEVIYGDGENARLDRHHQAATTFPIQPTSQQLHYADDAAHNNAGGHNFGDEAVFNRVWFWPETIAIGFIVEDDTYDIVIWNAYEREWISHTAVVGTDTDGTAFESLTLPWEIPADSTRTMELTVYEEGPPMQDTLYNLTVEGEVYTTHVTGIRVLGFIPDPSWDEELSISYRFQTTIFDTQRFVEQRRPLYETVQRDASLTVKIDRIVDQQLLHTLMYGHDKVFGIPIYTEKMSATDIPQGGSTITLSADNSDLWNLNNIGGFIAIIDHYNWMGEIKAIDSITSTTIVTATNISKNFDEDTTYIYPVFFGTIKNVSITSENDLVDRIPITFEEFTGG